MIHHILIAGLSSRFHDRFRQSLGPIQTRFRQVNFISAPMPQPKNSSYGLGYVRSLESRLTTAIQGVDGDQAVLVIYFNYGASSARIIETFHRYSLLKDLEPPIKENLSHNQEGQVINQMLEAVRENYETFRSVISCIQDEVVNRRNRTPLLLPTFNFDSLHLSTLIHHLSVNLMGTTGEDQAKSLIRLQVQQFEAQHPTVQVETSNKKAYRNDAGTYFVAPGNNLHGTDHLHGDNHNNTCKLGARVRLGHSFHRAFHYDCSCPKNLPRTIPSCHGSFDRPKGSTHVNLAPNDFARKAG